MSLFDSRGTIGNNSLSRWSPSARTARSRQLPNEATIVQKWQMRNSSEAGNCLSWEQIFFPPSLPDGMWLTLNLLGDFILVSEPTVNTGSWWRRGWGMKSPCPAVWWELLCLLPHSLREGGIWVFTTRHWSKALFVGRHAQHRYRSWCFLFFKVWLASSCREIRRKTALKAPVSSIEPCSCWERGFKNRFWCDTSFTSTCKPPHWTIYSPTVDSASFSAAALEKLFNYHPLPHTLVRHALLITLIQHS